ncbi:helix-turn-helix domain-containing protein [Streptomyces sp. NPDC019990]|uniref:helix-turn-helix domain-containing protein n=1 Tax=Streptomyces sp. NPDC019990 TaxID=3154693 RepID=UPI0033DFEAA7
MSSTRKPRLTGEARQAKALELKGKYYAGASIRNLVERTGYSYGTVRNLLVLAKTQFRRRGGGRPRAITDQAERQVEA